MPAGKPSRSLQPLHPVLHPHAGHADELLHIVRHNDQPLAAGVCADLQVMGDRLVAQRAALVERAATTQSRVSAIRLRSLTRECRQGVSHVMRDSANERLSN
ncbi:hypothetical protein JQC79_23010 [Ochrobactrum anthropi]|nr:hypothetical protein [Brucella anthropi]